MPVTPDPVRTQITAPSTNYVPEAAPNKTEENRQLNLGVNAIGKMFGDLANREKQRQVASDIMVAENAAIRGELLPGTLLPVAVDAYNKAVDNIAANEMLVEHEIKRSSKDYVSVIDDPSITTDVKNKAVDDQRALTFARAAQYITDPDVLLSLSNKLTTGVLVDKKLVIEAEANQRNLVMIKQIQNKIKNNDSIKNETIDEAGNVISTSSEFNAKWINETAAELGEYNAYVPEHLRKLLAFKVLAKSSDAVENPNIIHKLLLEEYSPGFTYGNLLLATGDDAEEHLKTYTTFLTESAAYAKSTRKAETERVKKERIDLMNSLSAKGDVKSVLSSSLTISDKNTVLTAIKKYDSNQPQIEIDSDTFLSYKEKIITGRLKLTKATLEHHGHIANFSTEAVSLLQQYLTEEGEQLVRNENALIDSVKTLDQNLVSLGKTELFQDGKLLAIIKKAGLTGWTQELRERLQNKTVPAALQAALIEQINDFRRDMAVVRGKVAQRAANQNNQSGSLSEKAIEAYSKQWNERFRNVAEGIDEKHFLKMNQDTKNKEEKQLRLQKALSLKEQKKADKEAAEKLKTKENEKNKGFVDQILEVIREKVIDILSPEEADAAQDSNFNPDTPKSGGFTGPDSKEIAVKPRNLTSAANFDSKEIAVKPRNLTSAANFDSISKSYSLSKNKITVEEYEEAQNEIRQVISFIESSSGKNLKQLGNGPATGIYQYEPASAKTAINRLIARGGEDLTKKLGKTYNLNNLTEQEQNYLMEADHSAKKGSSNALSKVVKAMRNNNNKDEKAQALVEYWATVHKVEFRPKNMSSAKWNSLSKSKKKQVSNAEKAVQLPLFKAKILNDLI